MNVVVPKKLVPYIIGPDDKNITSIVNKCGCVIRIDHDVFSLFNTKKRTMRI